MRSRLANVRVCGAYRVISVVPMRGAIPWAQALLETSSSPSSEGHETPSPEDLPPRSMHDSYTEVLLPFASDPALFEQYTNASGGIRTGKLLEHLDSLAGMRNTYLVRVF